MKRMKKLLAVLMAVVMVMSLGSVSAMAAEKETGDKTITINGVSSGSTYYAYQIFSGTYKSGELTNIGTGSGLNVSTEQDITDITALLKSSDATINVTYKDVNYTDLGTFVTKYIEDNANESIAWIATLFSTYGADNPNMVTAFAEITAQFLTDVYYTGSYSNNVYTLSSLPDGYYLIVDATNVSGTSSAASRYMLVAAGEEIEQKSVTPSLDKQIKEGDDYVDSTSASIGEEITYVLTSAVPDMTGYSSYTFYITDTISKGLKLTETTSQTNVSSSAISEGLHELDITIVVGTETISGMRVYNADDASSASNYYYYYYTATDQATSVTTLTIVFNNFISSGYTKNDGITVTYKATLNENAVIGSTGNDNTVTLTYSNNPNLVKDGDEWKPSTDTGTTVEEEVVVYTYELDLTKVDSVDKTQGLSGAEFYLYYEDSGNTYYAILSGADGEYSITGWTTVTANKGTLISGTNGKLYIKGLGEEIYYLCETVAPTGYVVWEDLMEIVIDATTDVSATTVLSATIGGTAVEESAVSTSKGTITASITNSSSSKLPTTGGIGTTIFYVVGAILVVGAGVVLITRRRMASR